ncbi:TetR family transcriptional regulator [Frankia sp. CcI49]|uniref:TetR/AcrR family transcriptional regulator n=1 Tax=unclassified Frankia TaxID=2632575 RepID=UPI0006CA05AA|nr:MULTISPECIES: TetR/AcrR family transcriptional regulator [unclassified Frankia]KPM51637.1 TetR family transcriptional regulator [Frankia sp. R43]ONH59261.1 TetR family transcriptional regulator [Frankia sp. CcI49]
MARALTSKGEATRARIIAGAAARIRTHGVAATTLDDIREQTATSKSQLFHYFPGGREDLLLAVARHEADQVLADQQPQLGALTSWAAWEGWRDRVLARYQAQGRDCPLGGLLTQVGRATPGAQAVVAELMGRWESELAAGVAAMRATGQVGAEVDPARHAAALLAGVQGGVLMLMSTGRLTYLQAALDVGIDALRHAGR